MKYRVFVLLFLLLSSCAGKITHNISTSDAYKKYGNALKNRLFFVFPESRENPLKWYDSIPEHKLRNIDRPGYNVMKAGPGEIFVFHLGLWAVNSNANDVQVEFSDLKGRAGTISSLKMTCYNLGGIDFRGHPFTKDVSVPRGRIQALWIGIDLDSARRGTYRGNVAVTASGEKQIVPVAVRLAGDQVPNHGYNRGSELSRLNWLNSTAGIDDEVTKGFSPVTMEDKRISITGRAVEIDESGLPKSVLTYFSPSNQSIGEKGQPIITRPFRFVIEKKNGEIARLVPGRFEITGRVPARVSWQVHNTSREFDLLVSGQMEFDGFIDYRLKLTSRGDNLIRDIRLEVPFTKENAVYMMGLGHEGGVRPPEWKWRWDTLKNQDMLWVGGVNGGIRIKLKAENYVHPLINVYYKFGPLRLPPSWGNEGQGGIDLTERESDVLFNAYSGQRELKNGECLNYDFELLITPFKVIDRQIKFGDRYYHGGGTNTSVKVDAAVKAGANILNIHHAEDIYPFINYPYLDANVEALRHLADQAHSRGVRLKLYYTTREFTKNIPEFWAFNSLNGEIVYPGPGNSCKTVINPDGPKEWYIKNLRENYIPAWYNEIKEGKFKGETDLSVISTPDSRLNNFYVAGLDWMVQNLGIDGVYIDDSALDRYTLMRARKIIDRYRPEARMDLHSWNHFNEWAGFASCLNLYMDLLPYFDLVWIGEGRDYNRAPDHWLVEVSGIPFGLTGQMLEGGGNPWRGMVYGITNRAGYLGVSPSGLWKFWDEHDFRGKTMTGYWDNNTPVRTTNPMTLASVYFDNSEAVIAVANWSDSDQVTSLRILWPMLEMDPSRVNISVPEVDGFQSGLDTFSAEQITIPGKKGFLILITRKGN
jgi:hypothetical protein